MAKRLVYHGANIDAKTKVRPPARTLAYMYTSIAPQTAVTRHATTSHIDPSPAYPPPTVSAQAGCNSTDKAKHGGNPELEEWLKTVKKTRNYAQVSSYGLGRVWLA